MKETADDIRKMFYPRQVLTIPDVAPLLGVSKQALYKRLQGGSFPLPVRVEGKRHRILIDDLVRYLSGITLSPENERNEPVHKRSNAGRKRKTWT